MALFFSGGKKKSSTEPWGAQKPLVIAGYDALAQLFFGPQGANLLGPGSQGLADSGQWYGGPVRMGAFGSAARGAGGIAAPSRSAPDGRAINPVTGRNMFARAKGGPVVSGQAYLVGEEGPEVIVPQEAGTVIPNKRLPKPLRQPRPQNPPPPAAPPPLPPPAWDPIGTQQVAAPSTKSRYPAGSLPRLLEQQAPRFYGGDLVADLTPAQQLALRLGAEQAATGSGLTGQARGLAGQTLGGAYMDPASNPWLGQTWDRAADDITRRVGSMATASGMTGSTGHAQALSRELAGVASDLYGQNYQRERERQLGLLGMAPQLDYADIDRLFGFGQIGQQQQQRETDAARERWDYEQNKGLMQLQNYLSLLFGGPDYSSSSSSGWSAGI